jgi:hypothetical protein
VPPGTRRGEADRAGVPFSAAIPHTGAPGRETPNSGPFGPIGAIGGTRGTARSRDFLK